MSQFFPQLDIGWYGALVGPLFTVPFALFSLVAGQAAQKGNRKVLLGSTIAVAAATMGVSALTDNFGVFSFMSVLEGAVESGISIFVYSLIADTFASAERRTFANTLVQVFN